MYRSALPRSVCVIFNPQAARGRAGRRLRRIRQLLADQAEFRASEAPGQCEILAAEAARAGFRTVVAAGGDGTVHEVANGILGSGGPEVALGVLPLGSGNDYAHALDLPSDPEAQCRALLAGGVRHVDVGRVRDQTGRSRYFVNTLGAGFSGAVAVESRRIEGLQGLALYGLAVLRALARHFHAPESVLTIDGESCRTPTLTLIVALGPREGGGFVVAPEAALDDGWFDYLHAASLGRPRALYLLPQLALGKVPSHAALRLGRCRNASLQSERPLMIHLDGELFARGDEGVREVHVELLPKQLAVRTAKPHS